MTEQEKLKDLINRFEKGTTSPEEDMFLIDRLKSSSEMTKAFLEELKLIVNDRKYYVGNSTAE